MFPGFGARYNSNAARVHWPSIAYAEVSYACYKPGQWTEFQGHEITPVGRASGDIDLAIQSARRFAADMTLLPTNYWCWWQSWYKGSDPVIDGALISGDQTPILSKKYLFFKMLWTTVRPGWRFKAVTTDDTDLTMPFDENHNAWNANLAAFENPAHTSTVVVIVNPTSTDKTDFHLSGLCGSHVSVSCFTSAQNGTVVPTDPVIARTFTLRSLPPRSITLVTTH